VKDLLSAVGSGGGAAAGAAAGGAATGGAAAADEPAAEEKEEGTLHSRASKRKPSLSLNVLTIATEKEESDDDMGFGLFD
jgi:large subunit ribosomal protein LP1